jgi:hypothetical protein
MIVLGSVSNFAQAGCLKERVCLTVVSQRWMTESELKRLNLGLRMSAVRLRLSNNSENVIDYLTWQEYAVPSIGYKLVKTKPNGDFGPGSMQERTVSKLQSQFGNSSKYLKLPPNAFLEFDVPDWGNPRRDNEFTEHAFSIFIKFGEPGASARPTELISESFSPLTK